MAFFTFLCLIVLEVAEWAIVSASVTVEEGEVGEDVAREAALRVILTTCIAGGLTWLALVVFVYIKSIRAFRVAPIRV
jgi:hypothetical protein